MKKSIYQIYAGVICVVAVITFLICISTVFASFIDYLDPLNSSRTEISLSSFEYFKMDLLKTTTKDQFYIPSDVEIQKMYDAAKEQHLEGLHHRIIKSFAVNGLAIVLSLLLFFTHWRLLNRSEPE